MEGYPTCRDSRFEDLVCGSLGYLATGPIAEALVKADEPALEQRTMIHGFLAWLGRGQRAIGLAAWPL